VYRNSLTVLFAAVLLSPTTGAPVPKDGKSTPYFPTQKGTRWTYTLRHNDSDDSFVITEVAEKDGEKFISVGREAKGGVTPAGKFKLTKEGGIESVGIREARDVPLPALDKPAKPGDEWEEDSALPGNVPAKQKTVIRGPERVKVPAGTFEALRVERTITFVGPEGRTHVLPTLTSWYAPGVGLIREEGAGRELGALKSFTPGKE
jgi:hypothetical protein